MQVQNNPVAMTDKNPVSQKKELQSDKAELKGDSGVEKKDGTLESDKEKTSVYLKVVSRLESMIKKGDLSETSLKGFSKAVQTRLEEMKENDKKTLSMLEEFKALKLEGLEKIPEFLEKNMKNPQNAEKILALLKHPKFAELMDAKREQPPQTYSPQSLGVKGGKNLTPGNMKEVVAPTGGDATVHAPGGSEGGVTSPSVKESTPTRPVNEVPVEAGPVDSAAVSQAA
ncbi:MAG: hypothetical protein HQM11_00620 [SAR324 cluster bacterium]|nr:hypothetical protein [SAR324 cluster bacterium]